MENDFRYIHSYFVLMKEELYEKYNDCNTKDNPLIVDKISTLIDYIESEGYLDLETLNVDDEAYNIYKTMEGFIEDYNFIIKDSDDEEKEAIELFNNLFEE